MRFSLVKIINFIQACAHIFPLQCVLLESNHIISFLKAQNGFGSYERISSKSSPPHPHLPPQNFVTYRDKSQKHITQQIA